MTHNTMEYYSAIKRNAFESVLMRWMNLEQNEVSQKEKYHILTHIYKTEKNDNEEFYSQWRNNGECLQC